MMLQFSKTNELAVAALKELASKIELGFATVTELTLTHGQAGYIKEITVKANTSKPELKDYWP